MNDKLYVLGRANDVAIKNFDILNHKAEFGISRQFNNHPFYSLKFMEQQGEIVLYQPETTFKLEVRLENETVWLTQAQIAELFGTGRQSHYQTSEKYLQQQ